MIVNDFQTFARCWKKGSWGYVYTNFWELHNLNLIYEHPWTRQTCSESQRSVHLEYLSKCVKAVINLKLTHRCNYYWTTYSLHMCVNLQSSLYTNFKGYLIVYLNTMAVPDLRKLRATFKLCSLKFCYYVLYFHQWHVVKHYPKIQMRA